MTHVKDECMYTFENKILCFRDQSGDFSQGSKALENICPSRSYKLIYRNKHLE